MLVSVGNNCVLGGYTAGVVYYRSLNIRFLANGMKLSTLIHSLNGDYFSFKFI